MSDLRRALGVNAEIGDRQGVPDRLAGGVELEHRVVVDRVGILARDLFQGGARLIPIIE